MRKDLKPLRAVPSLSVTTVGSSIVSVHIFLLSRARVMCSISRATIANTKPTKRSAWDSKNLSAPVIVN